MLDMVDTISLMYAWVLLLSQFVTFLTKIYNQIYQLTLNQAWSKSSRQAHTQRT